MSSLRRPTNIKPELARGFAGVFAYSTRALGVAWTTSRPLTIAFGLLTLIAGALPAAVAYVGALIVDAVVAAIQATPSTREALTHARFMAGGGRRRARRRHRRRSART